MDMLVWGHGDMATGGASYTDSCGSPPGSSELTTSEPLGKWVILYLELCYLGVEEFSDIIQYLTAASSSECG